MKVWILLELGDLHKATDEYWSDIDRCWKQVLPDAEGREYPLVAPSNIPVRRALDIAESANASDNSAITQCDHKPNTVVSIECPKCNKVFDRTVVYRTAQ